MGSDPHRGTGTFPPPDRGETAARSSLPVSHPLQQPGSESQRAVSGWLERANMGL